MRRTSFADMACSLARTLEVVGEWWTLLVLRDLFSRLSRFEDIRANLGGIAGQPRTVVHGEDQR